MIAAIAAFAPIVSFVIGALCGGVLSAFILDDSRAAMKTAAVCGIGFALTAQKYGISAYTIRMWSLMALTAAAALCDLLNSEIPDLIPALAVVFYAARLPFEVGFDGERLGDAAARGVAGAVLIGGGMLLLSLCVDKASGRDTLGGGDIKLLAAVGLHLGAAKGMIALIAACVSGLIRCAARGIGDGDQLPFAPSIAFGVFLTAAAGCDIAAAYERAVSFL